MGAVDERGVVVERVRSDEHETEQGGGFWPANPKSERGGFIINLGKKSFTGGVV